MLILGLDVYVLPDKPGTLPEGSNLSHSGRDAQGIGSTGSQDS